MNVNRSVVVVLIAAAALAAGCAQGQSYTCAKDFGLAAEQAGLIVAGEAAQVDVGRHWLQGEVRGAAGQRLGTDCVAEQIVKLKVDRVVKGPPDAPSPLEFRYLGPCFHPAKGAKVERPAPAVLPGDKVMAYLVNRGGQWWLIAHQIELPQPASVDPGRRVRLYTGE